MLRTMIVPSLVLATSCASPPTRPLPPGGPVDCEVHRTALRPDTIPITYGLVYRQPAAVRAEEVSFPHASTRLLGGCVIGSEKYARLWYCPDCRAAQSTWLREQARVRPADGEATTP